MPCPHNRWFSTLLALLLVLAPTAGAFASVPGCTTTHGQSMSTHGHMGHMHMADHHPHAAQPAHCQHCQPDCCDGGNAGCSMHACGAVLGMLSGVDLGLGAAPRNRPVSVLLAPSPVDRPGSLYRPPRG